MDPTKLLEADHREVEALFAALSEAEGDDRTPLIEQLDTAVRAHMKLEETVLYPAMAPVTGEEEVEEGNKEHELARKALADMVALGPDDPGFGAAMEATKAGIEHHVEEEEGTVFPKLRQDGAILERLAAQFVRTRSQLGLPTDAATLAAAANKEELLADARSAGIDGAASMNKEELADAVIRSVKTAS